MWDVAPPEGTAAVHSALLFDHSEDTPMSGTQEPEEEQDRDDVLEETFPASDPPSHGGSTGPDEPARPGQPG